MVPVRIMPAQGSVLHLSSRSPARVDAAVAEERHERQRPVLRPRRARRRRGRRSRCPIRARSTSRARGPTSACRCARSRRPTRRRRSAPKRIRRSSSTTRRARTPIPTAKIDIRSGLPPLRARWIESAATPRSCDGLTSAYGRARLADAELAGMRFDLQRQPRRAKAGRQRHADALRAARHRHAGDGVHRDPREPEARGNAARRCPSS